MKRESGFSEDEAVNQGNKTSFPGQNIMSVLYFILSSVNKRRQNRLSEINNFNFNLIK